MGTCVPGFPSAPLWSRWPRQTLRRNQPKTQTGEMSSLCPVVRTRAQTQREFCTRVERWAEVHLNTTISLGIISAGLGGKVYRWAWLTSVTPLSNRTLEEERQRDDNVSTNEQNTLNSRCSDLSTAFSLIKCFKVVSSMLILCFPWTLYNNRLVLFQFLITFTVWSMSHLLTWRRQGAWTKQQPATRGAIWDTSF